MGLPPRSILEGKMLATPEKGSRGSIKLWLAGKSGSYVWDNSATCACGQYVTEHYGEEHNCSWLNAASAVSSPSLIELNMHARDCAERTFEALYEDVCEAWKEEAAVA